MRGMRLISLREISPLRTFDEADARDTLCTGRVICC